MTLPYRTFVRGTGGVANGGSRRVGPDPPNHRCVPDQGGTAITDYLLYAILGLGSGAVISFIALGIVLGYRGSGVINFAQGAMGMYVAYVFFALSKSGQYP